MRRVVDWIPEVLAALVGFGLATITSSVTHMLVALAALVAVVLTVGLAGLGYARRRRRAQDPATPRAATVVVISTYGARGVLAASIGAWIYQLFNEVSGTAIVPAAMASVLILFGGVFGPDPRERQAEATADRG